MTAHKEGAYIVDNTNVGIPTKIYNACADFLTLWLSTTLKLWLRVWLIFLMIAVLAPWAFLPHGFAIANVIAFFVILYLNGRELFRVRGINKNMGWPHLVGWVPVLVINVLYLSTDVLGDQVTFENVSGAYKEARVVVVWYNTIILGISCLFDAFDTFLYYSKGMTDIERSDWTTAQLEKASLVVS